MNLANTSIHTVRVCLMAPSRVEAIFPKTDKVHKWCYYRALKVTRLEDTTSSGMNYCTPSEISRLQKVLQRSSDSTMAQILWWETAFFIGLNYNAQNRLLYGVLVMRVLLCPHVLKRLNLTHLMRVPGNSMSAEPPPIFCCLGHRMTWLSFLHTEPPVRRRTEARGNIAVL